MRRLVLLALTLGSFAPLAAQGGPPMLTDDPGTPGNRHLEVNLALTSEVQGRERSFEAPLVDVNYGIGERLQLKVEAPLVFQRSPGGNRTATGDVGVGVKWRFLDQGRHGSPVDVSTYPQVSSLAALDDGHRPTELLLPVQVAWHRGAFGINGDAGYATNSEETTVTGGVVVGYEVSGFGEVMAEVHESSIRTTGEFERFFNAGLRRDLRPGATLLASAGHSLATREHVWIGYLALQLTR
jgi:hypothetical protein